MSADQYTRERPFHHLSEGQLWITTTVEDHDRIVQEIVHKLDGMSRTILRNVINLQDEGLRKALVELGWEPPLATQRVPAHQHSMGECDFCERWNKS